jgi:hypothetical protein
MADERYDPGKAIGPDNRSYEQYLAERRLLIESERAAGDNFDKVLLTLSAGSIALSVTFVEKIGAAGVAKPLLYIAWAVLASALIANLRSFMVLQLSINRVMEINDVVWETGPCALSNPYRPKIMVLNRWSFRLFICGIVLLLTFAALNFEATEKPSGGSVMTERDKLNTCTVTEVKKSAGGPSVVKLPPPPPPPNNSSGGSSGGSNTGSSK